MVEWWQGSWARGRWGDLASVAGLILTLFGFGVTLSSLNRTRREVRRIRSLLSTMDAVSELSALLAALEELKRLHREGSWVVSLYRYSELRRKCVALRHGGSVFSLEQRSLLLDAIRTLRHMEDRVEQSLQGLTGAPDVPRLNGLVSDQMDRLEGLLTDVKGNEGGTG
jgi:hypothetical protein